MNRREALKGISIGLMGLVLPEISFSDRKHVAGKLILYDETSHDLNTIEEIFERTLENFHKIGIEFEEARIERERSFPPLEGSDFCLYLMDNVPVGSLLGVATLSKRVIRNWYWGPNWTVDDYLFLKNYFNFPYDSLTGATHMGFADLRPGGISLNKKEIDYFVLLCTHEISHSLTATHVFDDSSLNVEDEAYKYFMCPYLYHLDTPPRFHDENVRRMKEFIQTIKRGDLSDQEILSMKWISWRDVIYLGEQVTTQESSPSYQH